MSPTRSIGTGGYQPSPGAFPPRSRTVPPGLVLRALTEGGILSDGISTSLKPSRATTDTLPRVTTVPEGTRHGIPLADAVGFPVPGCLAGGLPQGGGHSTSDPRITFDPIEQC
jgi:hypothetical protein